MIIQKNGYYVVAPGESQYDDVDISKPVIARCIHAASPSEAGNPLIEAIPPPLEDKDTLRWYSHGIPGFKAEGVRHMTRQEKFGLIRRFREIRFALPFHQKLEDEFYNALCESYSVRHQVEVTDVSTTCIIGGVEANPSHITWGEPSDPTFGYFSLTGVGGVGKTSAIKALLSHYPQVLVKETPEGNYTQILYIFVSCFDHSNLSSLYDAIGRGFDHALGNTSHNYQHMIEKTRGLAGKASKVMELIELYSTGIIIFDEIQKLDYESSTKGSFASLMDLQNYTHVATAFIGTEEARDKMFSKIHTARRAGSEIDAGEYCSDMNFFKIAIENLFRYQVFDEPVEVTDDIIEAMYDCTKGILDIVITLYSRISIEYIELTDRRKKPAVDGDFIRQVARRYYPGLEKLLAEHDYEAIGSINDKAKKEMDKLLESDLADQKAQTEKIIRNAGDLAQEQLIRDNVTAFIISYMDFTPDTVDAAVAKAIRIKPEGNEKEITTEAIKILTKQPARRSRKPKTDPVDTGYLPDMTRKEDAG